MDQILSLSRGIISIATTKPVWSVTQMIMEQLIEADSI